MRPRWARWCRCAPRSCARSTAPINSRASSTCSRTRTGARAGAIARWSVDRLACVDLPAFPLQLLCRRNPAWAQHPVVVVEEDAPQGRILWVNEKARAARILPGHRYAHGLSLARDLRAGVVSEREI